MRPLLILSIYAVYLGKANDEINDNRMFGIEMKEFISIDFGRVHLRTKIGNLPEKHVPLRWDDKYATQKTKTLVNFVKSLPKLNPLNISILGPYNVSIPDVNFVADLNIWNLVVTGIKGLTASNIEMRVASPRIDFNISIPRFTVEADFLINGFYESIRIFDGGHINVTLLDLGVKAAIGPVKTRTNAVSWYKLESADVAIDLKDLQLRMNVTAFAENTKLILNHFFQHTQDLVVDNHLISIILNAINHELRKIPAKQIVHYMLGTSSIFALNGFNHKEKRISARKYGK